jgi:hypothetical protein
MMFKIRQDLTIQQSPKHPGLVRRFLHGHQDLNLTEGHHSLNPILWHPASILEDSKLSGVLGASGWVVWIHEKLQLDPLRLVRVISINFFHLLHLGNKRNEGGGFPRTEGGKTAVDLENSLMAIVWIENLQQKCGHSALC